MSQHKAFPLASFKAAGDAPGTFEALVSVFNNVDLIGDRVMPGAFTKSLEEWRASGDPIPVVWSHMWDNPQAHIGYVDPADAQETPDGLLVKGVLDVEKPFAAQVYDLLKARRVKEFSFAYDIGAEGKSADGANELERLDLIELGPTLKGMNPDTQLVTVKSAAKATVYLHGSQEQLHSRLMAAVNAWAADYRHDQVFGAAIEATFDDHVIVYVEGWDDPPGEGIYYQLSYTATDEGIELGDPTVVTVTGTLMPKAQRSFAAKRAKEGRRNSNVDLDQLQKVHDLVVGLGAACAAAEPDETKSVVTAPPANGYKVIYYDPSLTNVSWTTSTMSASTPAAQPAVSVERPFSQHSSPLLAELDLLSLEV